MENDRIFWIAVGISLEVAGILLVCNALKCRFYIRNEKVGFDKTGKIILPLIQLSVFPSDDDELMTRVNESVKLHIFSTCYFCINEGITCLLHYRLNAFR